MQAARTAVEAYKQLQAGTWGEVMGVWGGWARVGVGGTAVPAPATRADRPARARPPPRAADLQKNLAQQQTYVQQQHENEMVLKVGKNEGKWAQRGAAGRRGESTRWPRRRPHPAAHAPTNFPLPLSCRS